MRFETTGIERFYRRWRKESVTVISQSNPEPFSLLELEGLIGDVGSLFDSTLSFDFTPTGGSEKLREAIASQYERLTARQVVPFCGAQEAIFCAMHALLKPGDKVAAISPIFEPLVLTAKDVGCDVELIPLQPQARWALDLDRLEKVIKGGCRLLVLNFPHNPTGAMISRAELERIIAVCEKYRCRILSDEVFRGLEYEFCEQLSAVADVCPGAVSIGVMSKAYALPALRIGWLGSQDQTLLERVVEIKSHLSICNSLLDEQVAVRVIEKREAILQRNNRLIATQLEPLKQFFDDNREKFRLIPPEAGCCAFPLVSGEISAGRFAEALIEQKQLMVLPGELFCGPENGFRIGFGFQHHASHYSSLAGV